MPRNWDVVYTKPIFVWPCQQIKKPPGINVQLSHIDNFNTSQLVVSELTVEPRYFGISAHTSNTFSLVNGMAAGSAQPAATTSRCMYGA